MDRNKVLLIAGLMVLAAAGTFGLILAGPTSGDLTDSTPISPQADLTESLAATTATSGGGTHEGIKVHGHWVIEVREPDGRLASRHEFDNALTGVNVIPKLLARETSAGLWEMQLRGSSGGTHPCQSSSGLALRCHIVESASSKTLSRFFKTLTLSTPTTGGKFVLSGTATAMRSGDIGIVSTALSQCAASVAPSSPCEIGYIVLTTATLTTPVSVSAGQSMLVIVTISFS